MNITDKAPDEWATPHLEIEDMYPTEEALEAIRDWPYDRCRELILALKEAWLYDDYFYEDESVPNCSVQFV